MKYTTQEGFTWEIVTKERAIALLQAGAEVYKVYDDESESLIDIEDELWDVDGLMFYAIDGNTARVFQKQAPVKWARVDSATGKGMNVGYCVLDGEAYFENESDLIKYLREVMNVDENNELSDEFILEEAYANEEYYYTEWEVEDEEYWYEEQEDGTLKEVWAE
jgi:hypothetical protein